MRYRIRTQDWFRPLVLVLVRILAWAVLLAMVGAVGAYALVLYFTLKGF
jgi:hypothetical protein